MMRKKTEGRKSSDTFPCKKKLEEYPVLYSILCHNIANTLSLRNSLFKFLLTYRILSCYINFLIFQRYISNNTRGKPIVPC
jgi:hypothetical protein